MEKRQYTGTVTRFGVVGRHGRVRCVELGMEVFFHQNQGQQIAYDPDRREIVGYIDAAPSREPEPGDTIIFEYEQRGPGQDRAKCWGLEIEYRRALRQMQKAA